MPVEGHLYRKSKKGYSYGTTLHTPEELTARIEQMYEKMVPDGFLDDAILGAMDFNHIDAEGLHFSATLCIPDGASCYMVDTQIAYTGKQTMSLLEY